MRLFIIYSVYLFVLFFIVVCTGVSATKEDNKRSRIQMLYLTPSRRIGRSDHLWNDNPATSKRKISKLMAFPRVGRGNSRSWLVDDDYNNLNKRTSGNSGMWFGPRLGRVQKRDALDGNTLPQTYIIFGGDDLTARNIDYTPRLGRESEETLEEEAEINAPLVPDSQ